MIDLDQKRIGALTGEILGVAQSVIKQNSNLNPGLDSTQFVCEALNAIAAAAAFVIDECKDDDGTSDSAKRFFANALQSCINGNETS